MGSLSLNRIDHLLWLGRYLERSFTTQRFILSTYDRVADRALDDLAGDWRGQLADLGFRCETETPLEFFQRCLFNRDNPSSVACSMDAAYDNALACRDALGTESLGYIQMAVNALEADPFLLEVIGRETARQYIDSKRKEWSSYRSQVTQWEIREYLNRY